MADSDPIIFNSGAADRIAAVVIEVERWKKPAKGQQRRYYPTAETIVWVKLTGKAAGYGKYTGRFVHQPTDDVSEGSPADESEIGTVDTDEDEVLIINARETGKSTWDLWDGDTEGENSTLNPTVFMGQVRRMNDDGKLVVAIDGLKTSSCGS